MSKILLTVALLMASVSAQSQQTKIAFYNVENLFDTIKSPLINDVDFTPKGANNWTSQKYQTKIQNIAKVIDDIRADIIGIAEVENEGVVRDLLTAMKSDYNYIHRNTSDSRGIDLALFYKGDTFFPKKIEQVVGAGLSRELLVVHGDLHDTPITIIVCHMPSMMNSTTYRNRAATSLRTFVESLLKADSGKKIVIMGDFNANPTDRIATKILGMGTLLHTPFTELKRLGYGTYIYRDKRSLFDFIAISPSLQNDSTFRYSGDYGIFTRDYMIQRSGTRKGYNLGNSRQNGFTPGFSDHLPVVIEFIRK